MKKISQRQLIIFYCIYSFAIKFLMLPQLLSTHAGKDAWLSALFGTVLELAVLFLVLNVLIIGRDGDIYSDIRNNTKAIGGKIIIALMLAVFLLQAFILIRSAYHLLNDNLFEDISVKLFSVPMLIMGIFFCFLPARAIFRSGEIFYVFIIIGIALSVFPALSQISASEILPIADHGAKPMFTGFYYNLIYFESASFLLMFSGDIKIEKHFRKKFMITAGIVGLFFVFFVFMFYSLFGPLAATKNIAVANLTLYSSFITNNGRLDWVLITIWLLLLMLRFGVTFYCCFTAVRYITNVKHRAGLIGLPLAVFIYLITTLLFASQESLNNFIKNIPWLIAGLYILIPVLFFINSLINKKKKAEVTHV